MKLKNDDIDSDVHHHLLEYPDIVDDIADSNKCHSTGVVTLMMWLEKVSMTKRNDIYSRSNLLQLNSEDYCFWTQDNH